MQRVSYCSENRISCRAADTSGGRLQVVVTARSDEKGKRVIESVKPHRQKQVSYVVVQDIAKEAAFDQVASLRSWWPIGCD